MRAAEPQAGAEGVWAEEPSHRLRLDIEPAPLRIVAIGGGTGLPAVLLGLSSFANQGGVFPRLELTAVVAVSDDGGSSGRLRRDGDILAPGDIRNCLVALASGAGLAQLFQYRFQEGRELAGHALGNLVLAALAQLEGGWLGAIGSAERMLGCKGKVLPVTTDPVQLLGLLSDGSWLVGERTFEEEGQGKLRRVELAPKPARASPGVLEAIRSADVVILGPGSLYSSVIANLLVEGVAEALEACQGLRICVQNLLSQPGESEGLDALGHLEAIRSHAGDVVDVMLYDSVALQGRPTEWGQPVRWERRELLRRGVLPVEADLISDEGPPRHDPKKTALAILALALDAGEG